MRSTGRTIGAIAVVAAISALGAVLVVRSTSDERQSQPAAAPPSASAPARVPASVGRIERPSVRRLSRTVDGVRFSFSMPTSGWVASPIVQLPGAKGFRHGRLGISKSIVGPQGAEAIVFWTSLPAGDRADPCANLLRRHIGQSAAGLAAAVATAPGAKLVAGPSDVTVGGLPAKHVVLTVRNDLGLRPGILLLLAQ